MLGEGDSGTSRVSGADRNRVMRNILPPGPNNFGCFRTLYRALVAPFSCCNIP